MTALVSLPLLAQDVADAPQALRTRRHRPIPPVLLANADGAGAQGAVGGNHPVVLHREKRDRAMAGRDKAVDGFRKSLDPLRLTLRTQAFLGGTAANYADYIVFGRGWSARSSC